MRSIFGLGLTILIFLLIEYLVFLIIQTALGKQKRRGKSIFYSIYFTFSLFMLVIVYFFNSIPFDQFAPLWKSLAIAGLLGFFGAKILIALFFLINLLLIGFQWTIDYFAHRKERKAKNEEGVKLYEISRSRFLSIASISLGTAVFGSLIQGIRNKYNYKIRKAIIPIENLPKELENLKIIQISDIHAGSFDNKDEIEKGIQMILRRNPNLIVFTGDLVNNVASEIEPYIDIFKKLKAPLGVYSVLGNHDYGDYFKWDSEEEKKKNLESLIAHHKSMGWDLLNNTHRVLEYNEIKFNLIGVENWGAKGRFPKIGDLDKATENMDKNRILNILLSHDPSHWDAQVRPNHPYINLTLSGHTHGMQFGVRLPFMQWSPVQYMYKQWAGLYTEGRQHLYVNVGFGFLGYPGRVGIMPEITEISFTSK